MTNRQIKKAIKEWLDGKSDCPFRDLPPGKCDFCETHFPKCAVGLLECPCDVYSKGYVRRKANRLLEEL